MWHSNKYSVSESLLRTPWYIELGPVSLLVSRVRLDIGLGFYMNRLSIKVRAETQKILRHVRPVRLGQDQLRIELLISN